MVLTLWPLLGKSICVNLTTISSFLIVKVGMK